MAAKLAVVFGGSGFVGRNVVRELAKRGWRVRVAVRRPHLAQFLRPMGAVGQVQLAQANIRYRGSVAEALKGADAVVNLVGLLSQNGAQSFDAVQGGGAAVLAELAAEAGAKRFIHVSAIGADETSDSLYASSKGRGEKAVREAFPSATIIRPSIVFGPEDDFFNRFAAMANMSPALPLIGGGKTKFQPVYVDDVADAICAAAERQDTAGKIYELGGPRTYTFKELLQMILRETGKKRILAPLPFRAGAACRDRRRDRRLAAVLSTRRSLVTRSNCLKRDNVVGVSGEEAVGTIADLGVHPTTVEAILPSYMVRYRKYGQFAESAA